MKRRRVAEIALFVLCFGLVALSGASGQATPPVDIARYFRFEQYGDEIPFGIKVVRPFGDVLLLGGDRELVRSTDVGLTWAPVLTPLQNKNVRAILAHGDVVVVANAGGVYRSTDDGLYWERVGAEPHIRKVRALLRTKDGYLIANDSGECFRWTDRGGAWQSLRLPAPCLDFVLFDNIPWFVCANGEVLSDNGGGPKLRLRLSALDRVSLVQVDDFLAVVLDTTVLVLDEEADTLASWTLPIANWTATATLDKQLLLGGRSTGLKKMNLETGKTTSVFAGPADQENISALVVSNDTIVIGTSRSNGRCYVVSESSLQWRTLNPLRDQGTFDVTDLAYSSGVVYVATRDEGVFAGRIDGVSVAPIHDAQEQTVFHQLIPWGSEMLVVGRLAGIWRMKSSAGGLSWFTRTLPPSSEYFAASVGNRVVAGLSDGRVLWTDDDGKTWSRSADTLPSINNLTTVGNTLFACTILDLFRSDDQGETWQIFQGPWKQQKIEWVSGTSDTFFIGSLEATYRYLPGLGFTKLLAEFTPGKMASFTSVIARDALLFATGAPAVHISTDLGDTWYNKNFERNTTLAVQFFYKGYYHVFTDRGVLWRSLIP